MHTPDLDIELLEPLLRDFCRLVGLTATLQIVDTWGGLPLYFAQSPSADSPLAKTVGWDQAMMLGQEYGGERLMIPKAGKALRALRDRRICADHSTKSIRQLVRDYGLSERRICEILAADDQADDSLPLF